MAVRARHLYGNLVYYDAHFNRIIDAWGPGVKKYILGPHAAFTSADNLAGFTTTLVEGGGGETTVAPATTVNGGGILITTDAFDNDGANIQMTGEAFQPAANTLIYFGVKLQINDVTQSDLFVGLSITATDILGGVTDSIGFRKVDASAALSYMLEQDSTETTGTAIATMVADTDYYLEFVCNGVTVDFYVDGVLLTQLAQTNVPDDELLSPAIHFLTGEANAAACLIKELRVFRIAA